MGKEGEASVKMLTEFVEKARAGVHISTTDINKVARLFKVSTKPTAWCKRHPATHWLPLSCLPHRRMS